MFKKLFGKNKPEKIEVNQDWASFFCRIEDKPASIRLNLAHHEVAPINGYRQQIWFSVKLLHPDENGFTTREEFETINAIEDTIFDNISTKHDAILAGAIKTDGRLDLYMYATATDGIEKIVIDTMLQQFKEYRYAVDFKEDKEWNDYYNFLYPNPYEFQTIQNGKVIMQLREHGDNPEMKRKVDHWIYFKNDDEANVFIEAVIDLGYEILSKEKNEEHEFQYNVNIGREDVIIPHEVNDYVWELMELANKSNGMYDGWGCPIAN
ncbi:TIGR01619 family protein [Tenacibaculum sp. MAR_2009_124]|uniref:DUF695 domain-containing protein n=1 Tax=Tenacibaculum sp. MAR_2009_124 TaxID=1250059 RepID=UPI0008963308|nr:DUF695 domain-containing protein [Tenacibaculum sp. MAR_2009_124]SEC43480.1 TIGR01619 family protein [Tenacibaculum sp. MAR_2009_124]